MLTASEFGAVMAESDERAQRRRLLYRLAGERLSGELSEEWSNRHMERGKRLEPVARARYEKIKKTTVDQVGFIKNFTGLRQLRRQPRRPGRLPQGAGDQDRDARDADSAVRAWRRHAARAPRARLWGT